MSEEGSKRTLWIVLGVVGAVVLLCGGAVTAGVVWVGMQVRDVSNLPPEEQEAALAERLGLGDGEFAPRADAFLTALNEGRTEEAYQMTSSEVRASLSLDQFEELQARIDRHLGAYRSRQVTQFKTEAGWGSKPSSTLYTYAATYEHGKATLELRFVEQADGSVAIDRYHVDSPLLVAHDGGPPPSDPDEPEDGTAPDDR